MPLCHVCETPQLQLKEMMFNVHKCYHIWHFKNLSLIFVARPYSDPYNNMYHYGRNAIINICLFFGCFSLFLQLMTWGWTPVFFSGPVRFWLSLMTARLVWPPQENRLRTISSRGYRINTFIQSASTIAKCGVWHLFVFHQLHSSSSQSPKWHILWLQCHIHYVQFFPSNCILKITSMCGRKVKVCVPWHNWL